jgi:hypothetical protein
LVSRLEEEVCQKARGCGYSIASQCAVKSKVQWPPQCNAPWKRAAASALACNLRTSTASCAHFTTATKMAAIYRPSEAIALLRPSFILPRIQPSSRRTPSARFSTTRHAQALSSPPNAPIPPPQRKSITLAGDTGQVPWSYLSPGEKVVRTTQQSFNFVVRKQRHKYYHRVVLTS